MTAFEVDTLRFQLDRLTKEHKACSLQDGYTNGLCGKHECLFCYDTGIGEKGDDGWCLREAASQLVMSLIQHKDNLPKAKDDERSALIGAIIDSDGNCTLNVHSEGIVPIMILLAKVMEQIRSKFKVSEKTITDLTLRAYKILREEEAKT